MGKDLKGKELGKGITQRKDGRYIIDAKSILGVLSMGLPCEVDFVLNSDDPQRHQEFEWGLEPWKVRQQ